VYVGHGTTSWRTTRIAPAGSAASGSRAAFASGSSESLESGSAVQWHGSCSSLFASAKIRPPRQPRVTVAQPPRPAGLRVRAPVAGCILRVGPRGLLASSVRLVRGPPALRVGWAAAPAGGPAAAGHSVERVESNSSAARIRGGGVRLGFKGLGSLGHQVESESKAVSTRRDCIPGPGAGFPAKIVHSLDTDRGPGAQLTSQRLGPGPGQAAAPGDGQPRAQEW
jgi:hypothetical protein